MVRIDARGLGTALAFAGLLLGVLMTFRVLDDAQLRGREPASAAIRACKHVPRDDPRAAEDCADRVLTAGPPTAADFAPGIVVALPGAIVLARVGLRRARARSQREDSAGRPG